MVIGVLQLAGALNDALAVTREWDDGDIEAKLAAHGLDAEAVRRLLADRWQAHAEALTPRASFEGFAPVFLEGLITGLMVGRQEATDGAA